MKFSAIVLLSLLSTANAVGLGSIRGEEQDLQIDFACTLKGGSSQDTCDATTAQDGSSCVWCSYVSYGVCVSEDVAEQMKQTIPGLTCDDDSNDDDDNVPSEDDTAPVDDDTAPSDDSVPDDYWDCLKKYSTSEECVAAGCGWCDNKGGYGVCFDVETAKDFENSDWYSCTIPSWESKPVKDPTDPSCLIATIGGDESLCTSMVDADGNPCDWCSFQGFDFCVNDDQAELAEQYGASCGEDAKEETNAVGEKMNLFDPSDPSCLVVTIGGDESTCKETTDVDGKPCDWCSFQGYEFCVNVDQAQIVETYGADCGDRVEEEQKTTKVADPTDPSCLVATLTGDESSCKSTSDADGNPCDWCSFQGYDFCVNDEQAQLVEMYGADCGDRSGQEEETVEVTDPSDPTCLAVTIGGDESSCKATKDTEGNSCEWCSFQGYDFCLNDEQAQVVEQYGAACGESIVTSDKAASEVSDPSDPTCLAATIGGDESSCKATKDTEGNSCEWCSFQGYDFCLNDEQAQVVEQYGASCDKTVNSVSTSIA